MGIFLSNSGCHRRQDISSLHCVDGHCSYGTGRFFVACGARQDGLNGSEDLYQWGFLCGSSLRMYSLDRGLETFCRERAQLAGFQSQYNANQNSCRIIAPLATLVDGPPRFFCDYPSAAPQQTTSVLLDLQSVTGLSSDTSAPAAGGAIFTFHLHLNEGHEGCTLHPRGHSTRATLSLAIYESRDETAEVARTNLRVVYQTFLEALLRGRPVHHSLRCIRHPQF